MASREITIHSDEFQDFNNSIRVLAGPGAGKTFWITGQIRRILKSGDCDQLVKSPVLHIRTKRP